MGDKGDKGDPGPSTAYASSAAPLTLAQSPDWTTLDTLAVPQGSYVISAKLDARTDSSRSVRCELGTSGGGSHFTMAGTVQPDIKGEVKIAALALQFVHTTPTLRVYAVRCYRSKAGTNAVTADFVKLTAIDVGEVVD